MGGEDSWSRGAANLRIVGRHRLRQTLPPKRSGDRFSVARRGFESNDQFAAVDPKLTRHHFSNVSLRQRAEQFLGNRAISSRRISPEVGVISQEGAAVVAAPGGSLRRGVLGGFAIAPHEPHGEVSGCVVQEVCHGIGPQVRFNSPLPVGRQVFARQELPPADE